MKPVRIEMLGSGFVADFYMQGLADVRDQEVVVNYSRSDSRALSVRSRHNNGNHLQAATGSSN